MKEPHTSTPIAERSDTPVTPRTDLEAALQADLKQTHQWARSQILRTFAQMEPPIRRPERVSSVRMGRDESAGASNRMASSNAKTSHEAPLDLRDAAGQSMASSGRSAPSGPRAPRKRTPCPSFFCQTPLRGVPGAGRFGVVPRDRAVFRMVFTSLHRRRKSDASDEPRPAPTAAPSRAGGPAWASV